MPRIEIMLITWALLVVAFVIGWGRHFRGLRAADGVDEELYVNGLDDRSLDEAC